MEIPYLSFFRIFLFWVLPMCSLAATLEEDLAILIREPLATLGSSTSITVYTNPTTTVEFLKAVFMSPNMLIYEPVYSNPSDVINISNEEMRTTLNLASETTRKDGIYKVKVATGASTNITVIISNGNAFLESTEFPYVVLSEGSELSLHTRHVNEQFLESQIRWRHNGKPFGKTRASFTFNESNLSVDDEGVYECFENGDYRQFEHAVMSVIVRECPENRWGPTSCQNECPACENGGVCSDETGSCLCPPGFSGQQCERAHGRNIFGQNGQYKCDETEDDDDDGCRGFVICYIRPFGCSCPAGYTGIYCDEDCEEGKYGANCAQTCTCVEGETCARDTGQCYATDEDHTSPPDLLSYRKGEVLTFSTVSSSSINVSWPEWQEEIDVGIGPVTGYLLLYRSGSESFTNVNVRLSLSHVIDGLEADTEYEFKLAVVGPENTVGPLSDLQVQKTPCTEITSVPALSVVGKTARDVTFSLELPTSDELTCSDRSYNLFLQRMDESGQWQNIESLGQVSEVTVTDILPCTSYNFRIEISWSPAGMQSPITSTVVTVTSGAEEPGGVENLFYQAPQREIIMLYWTTPQDSYNPCLISSYTVEYRLLRHRACGVDEINSQVETLTTQYSQRRLRNLEDYSDYEVTVRAVVTTSDERTVMGRGVSITASTLANEPTSTVEGLSGQAVGNSIEFSWDPLSCHNVNGPGFQYSIQLNQEIRGSLSSVISQETANNRHRFDNLKSCGNYVLFVTPKNNAGEGLIAISSSIQTDAADPPIVLQLETICVNISSIHIGWKIPNPPCGIILGYDISVRLANGSHRNFNKTISVDSSDSSNQTTAIITDLNAYTTYSIKIRAKTRIGKGNWSEELMQSTEEGICNVPGIPVNLIVSRRALYDLTIEWDVPFKQRGTIVKYELQYKAIAKPYYKILLDEHAITLTINNPKDSNSYKIANLDPSTIYEILVSAYNSAGQGESASINGTTVLFKDLQAVDVNQVGTTRKETSAQVILPALTQLYATGYNIRIKTLLKRPKRIILTLGGFEENQDDYITAALDKEDNERIFTIGDGKTYGGYFNAPLKKEKQYEMYVHTLSRVGEEVEAVSSKPIQLHDEVSRSPTVVFLIPLIVASILVTVFCMIILKKRKTARTEKDNQNPDYEIPINVRQQEKTETQDEMVIHTCESGCANAENDAYLTSSRAAINEDIDLNSPTETYYDRVIENSRPYCIKVTDFQSFMAMGENDLADLITGEFMMLQRLQRVAKAADISPTLEAHPSGVTLSRTELVAVSNVLDANYMKDCQGKVRFIATQGPQNKFKAVEFWRMIWQNDVKTIVMLQDTPSESSDTFIRYWPEKLNTSEIYYEMTVLFEELLSFGKYTLRKMTIIKNNENVCRTVQQIQIHGWANREVPGDTTDLISIIQKVKILQEGNSHKVLVHCGDGCGATGTFIAVYCLMDIIKRDKTVCISDFVKTMREDRPGMVQTKMQYLFVYQTLREAQFIPDGSSISLDQLKASDDCSLQQKARKEYEMLQKMKEILKARDGIDGKARVNIHKNRFQNIIPGDYFRPILTSKGFWKNSNDYINATILESFDSRQIVITQSPMKNTVEDFWRLVYDYECSTIIMIDDLDCNDKTFAQYWPDAGKTTYGSMRIARQHEAVATTSSMRRFLLRHKMKQNSLSVQQFVCNMKPKEGQKYDVPKLAEFVAYTWNKLSNKCLIHCRNGVGLCVVYAIVMSQIKRLNLEGVCDVFLSAYNSIKRNQHVFQSQEEYTLCLELLRSYYVNETGYSEVL